GVVQQHVDIPFPGAFAISGDGDVEGFHPQRDATSPGLFAQVGGLPGAADGERAWEWDIDVLLNNAGSAEAGASAEIPLELVRALFETNVFANLELTQGFVRRMVEQKRGGKVLFVSSIAGLITGPYTGPYCASKHALEAFAEALHAELKPFGIQVGTINPGPYQTGFN
ncbi:SDR family NAD(P)-dependent oxidoreductase, partial [Pseudomonas aeruginosa]|uniref:SDR family NAD(P)-dependent oxidoreductase n=1 Tax=Pseudomonas aeruginosa TaxID=287 RepID=UPI0024B8379F